MSGKPVQTEQTTRLQETFLQSLMTDVVAAMERRSKGDNQSVRRELVRTLVAAIEGLVWTYREQILTVARTTGVLTASEELAFSETSYLVTDQGKIVEQARFMTILATVRLTTRLAVRISPEIEPRFDTIGWSQLRQTIKIRNRVTHPKSEADLVISKSDTKTCYAAFDWLFELCLVSMESAITAHREYVSQIREVLEGLKREDPAALAEYQAASVSILD